MEVTRDIKSQNHMVEATVKDALQEFGGLIHRSKDNGSQLGTLINLIEGTKDSANRTENVMKEKVPLIISSLDTQREAHRSLTTVADVLLEQTREYGKRIQLQEGHIKKLLTLGEAQLEQSQEAGISRDDLDHVVGRKTSQLLEEFSQFSETISAQQSQTVTLLQGLKEYFDRSTSDFERINTEVSEVVRKETSDVTNELSKHLKKHEDKTAEQLQTLDQDLIEVQNSLQATIVKAINNAATLSHPEMPTHDHLIPEIVSKLSSFELASKVGQESGFSDLSEKITSEVQMASTSNAHRMDELHSSIQEISADLNTLATSEHISTLLFKFEEFAQTIHAHYQSQLSSAESRLNDVVEKAESSEQAAQSRIMIAEKKAADMEARIQELEQKLAGQATAAQTAHAAHELELKTKISDLTRENDLNITALEKRAHDAEAATDALRKEMGFLKYLNTDIGKHEAKIESLETDACALQEKKEALSQELGNLNTAYAMRFDELRQLETRVEAFEHRLAQTILDRSKSILGSTTMAIINSAEHRSPAAPSKVEHDTPKGRRHLSLAPVNFENMAKELIDEKENDTITVMKRGSPLAKQSHSQRSVSLFEK